MKKALFFILIALVCLVLVCCADQEKSTSFEYFSFTDDSGFKLSLSEKPQRVAVLFSSHAEMVLLAGGEVDITVGESIERGFAAEGTPIVDSGAGKSINTELLISYTPDFVIGSYDIAAHRDAASVLNGAGIATALFHVESFTDYERVMGILCEIFGTEQNYKKNVSDVKERIDEVLQSVPKSDKKKILFVRCGSSSKSTKAKTKNESFVCLMLDELNTVNIADSAPTLIDGLSIEEIIVQNPDYIFFSPMGDETAAKQYMMSVLEKKQWQTLSAVKNQNYTFLDKQLFQYKPNNRWDIAYKTLAEHLYGKQ